MTDWYDEAIEEPVRDIVRLLRNNGFNTECSCGHEMYVQCQYIPDNDIERLHILLWNYFDELGVKDPTFTIEVKHQVIDGHQYSHMEISFDVGFPIGPIKDKRKHFEDQLAYHKKLLAYHRKFVKHFKQMIKDMDDNSFV